MMLGLNEIEKILRALAPLGSDITFQVASGT
jgi:hypothetical protein